MEATGGCYCGELLYSVSGDIEVSLQCHCRECQYIAGGNPNVAVIFAIEDFKYTKGSPTMFARSDLEAPVVRHFCANCGTGIGSRSPARPDSMIVKVGTFDDPSFFKLQVAIFTCDTQDYHHILESLPIYDKRVVKS